MAGSGYVRLCVELGVHSDTLVVDAVRLQAVTFHEPIDAVPTAVSSHALVLPVPGRLVTVLSRAQGVVLRDMLLTHSEYQAMADGLAGFDVFSTRRIVFTDWVAGHGSELGHSYVNELVRHFRPTSPPVAAELAR